MSSVNQHIAIVCTPDARFSIEKHQKTFGVGARLPGELQRSPVARPSREKGERKGRGEKEGRER